MVTPRFAPLRGGVETHVREVGRRLVADHGITVRVLTTDLDRSLPRTDEIDGIQVQRVRAVPRGSDLYWSPAVWRAVPTAAADLVHVQGYHTLVPPMAMIAARRANLPYLLSFHSGGHSSRVRRLIRPIQLAVLRPLLAGAARLVAVSDFEADAFARSGIDRRRIVTIANGADFPAGSDPGPQPREPGLILSVGRLEAYKGHQRVLKALPRIRAAVPQARLMILGTGPEASRLADLADALGVASVTTIGGVDRAELPALLRRAGTVALLSDYESQGIAAYEALALGAPLVVTGATALAELVGRPGVLGLPPHAATEEVARAVVHQLRTEPPSERLAVPSWDGCAAALASLYVAVLDARRSLARAS